MKTINHKSEILDRFKLANNLANNAELARFLDINPATVSNWYKRDSIDWDLIFSKCKRINLDWLITGEGDMVLDKDISYSLREPPEEYNRKSSGLMSEFYIDVIAKKEIEIKELNREIGRIQYKYESLLTRLEQIDDKSK